MHSSNVTNSTPKSVKDKITIEFNNFDLSEEYRVNQIFKGFTISSPTYNDSQTHFTRTYTKN